MARIAAITIGVAGRLGLRAGPVVTLALGLTLGACAGRGPAPRLPGSALPDHERAPGAAGLAAVVETALSFQGTPYRPGGADPSGFDCSGFVQYVFGLHGLALPRSVRELFEAGASIRPGRIQPGDLLFFVTSGRSVSHVGIAVDGTRFVHAPSSNGSVRVERYADGFWARRFAGARRVAPAGSPRSSRQAPAARVPPVSSGSGEERDDGPDGDQRRWCDPAPQHGGAPAPPYV